MRSFIAIDIPEEIKERLYTASAELDAAGIKRVGKNEMHITLQFLGEIDENGLSEAKDALSAVVGSGPFVVGIKGISVFTPSYVRVVFAEIAEGRERLISIYNEIGKGLSMPKGEREFVPHVTLARVKYVTDKKRISDFIEKYKGFEFGRFTVSEIKLKQSTLTSAGPIYKDLYEVKF